MIKTEVANNWSIFKKKLIDKLKKLKRIKPKKPCSEKLNYFFSNLTPNRCKKNLPDSTRIIDDVKKNMNISII